MLNFRNVALSINFRPPILCHDALCASIHKSVTKVPDPRVS